MTRATIIINPRSGRHGHRSDAGRARVALAEKFTRDAGLADRVDVVLTTSPGHAAELSRRVVSSSLGSSGATVVVAWGGDGTVNEVAGPLIGTPIALGIVAGGSGDGTARSLHLPTAPDQALRVAVSGAPARIDVGYLGDRHFLNIGGIGFDAHIAARFNARTIRGGGAYVRIGLSAVWTYRPVSYAIDLDGQSLTGPRHLVAFANGREYGNGLVLVPSADPTDGWLDVVVLDAGGPLRQLWRARRMAFRREAPAEGVHRFKVQGARVSGDALVGHVDGETFETSGSIEVRVAPGALLVNGARMSQSTLRSGITSARGRGPNSSANLTGGRS